MHASDLTRARVRLRHRLQVHLVVVHGAVQQHDASGVPSPDVLQDVCGRVVQQAPATRGSRPRYGKEPSSSAGLLMGILGDIGVACAEALLAQLHEGSICLPVGLAQASGNRHGVEVGDGPQPTARPTLQDRVGVAPLPCRNVQATAEALVQRLPDAPFALVGVLDEPRARPPKPPRVAAGPAGGAGGDRPAAGAPCHGARRAAGATRHGAHCASASIRLEGLGL
mmetsp:Transcript_123290/g.356234  ORF Transcript_123290/g.356234 Transcript_123290/m.356234 type:complete len:225 (+) Transcript_123290:1996-2670(+)